MFIKLETCIVTEYEEKNPAMSILWQYHKMKYDGYFSPYFMWIDFEIGFILTGYFSEICTSINTYSCLLKIRQEDF